MFLTYLRRYCNRYTENKAIEKMKVNLLSPAQSQTKFDLLVEYFDGKSFQQTDWRLLTSKEESDASILGKEHSLEVRNEELRLEIVKSLEKDTNSKASSLISGMVCLLVGLGSVLLGFSSLIISPTAPVLFFSVPMLVGAVCLLIGARSLLKESYSD